MKTVTLLHNPKAGGKAHKKDDLVELIESAGYKCYYADVKKSGWDKIEPNTDIIAIAGGDGTIRKIAIKLMENKTLCPIAIIPLGTANNISKTLNIVESAKEIIHSWKTGRIINYDIGRIVGLEKTELFLEGFGIGAFPELVNRMKHRKKPENETTDEEIGNALKTFIEIIKSIAPVHCTIEINEKTYADDYLLVEVMNTRCIGPNMVLNPPADTSDGTVEVVLIPESERQEFTDSIRDGLAFEDFHDNFKTLKTNRLKITWENATTHIDDELRETKGKQTAEIMVNSGEIKLLLPG